jgi:DNA repair protein RadC
MGTITSQSPNMMTPIATSALSNQPPIRKPEDILDYLRALHIQILPGDTLMLSLNHANIPIGRHLFPYNPINIVGPHPQQVFRVALIQQTARLILVSAHPHIRRGPFSPTDEQLNHAAQCSLTGQLLNLPLLDYLLLNDTSIESLLLNFHDKLSRYALRYSQQHANPLLTNLCQN